MDAELKKALEIIKSKLSKEEQVKELFSNDKGDVVLSDLDFTGIRVYIERLKAKCIYNGHQKADIYIYNSFQEAKDISNSNQIAINYLFNDNQKAKGIFNRYQKAERIFNVRQKANKINNNQQEELIKKL